MASSKATRPAPALAGCEPRGDDPARQQIKPSPTTPIAQAATATALSAPGTKAGRLQRACLDLLQQHKRDGTIPTNGRFVFYELEQRGIVPKAYRDASGNKRARTPAQDISDATMRLRQLGLVPWWWILDESRDVAVPRYAVTVHKYLHDTVGL